jgi:hypothetical protein
MDAVVANILDFRRIRVAWRLILKARCITLLDQCANDLIVQDRRQHDRARTGDRQFSDGFGFPSHRAGSDNQWGSEFYSQISRGDVGMHLKLSTWCFVNVKFLGDVDRQAEDSMLTKH